MERTVQTHTTGRYYISGNISDQTQVLWIALHGYAMRAEEFIKGLEPIIDPLTVAVAPEGLHRFYKRGTRGDIGANWMTSDLRLHDIENNVAFINTVLEDLYEQGLPKNVRICVLGFSQGGPTAARWASRLEKPVEQFIAWGTDFPTDVLDDPRALRQMNASNIKLIIGDKDEYIDSDKVDDLIMDLHDRGLDFDFHTFDGTHELHADSLRYFNARMLDDKSEY